MKEFPIRAARASAMKKVMIISSSLRPNSNSDILAGAFADGARNAGHEAGVIPLRGKDIKFCVGCLECQQTQRCVIHDEADSIVQDMKNMDVLAFAAPIYYYGMPGQLKTLLDRANPLFPSDYSFRDIYLLASAAENEDSAFDGAVHGLGGWIKCFKKTRLAGVLRGGGVTDPEEIRKKPELIELAYQMGGRI